MNICHILTVILFFSAIAAIVLGATVVLMWTVRDKSKMIGMGVLLFAIGFVIYFQPTRKYEFSISRGFNATSHAEGVQSCSCRVQGKGCASNGIVKNMADSLSSANRVLSAFYPSRGDYDNTPKDGWRAIVYWLFHLVAILYIMMLAVSFFGIELINRYWLKFFRRRPFDVFWGYGIEAKTLADTMSRKDVVFALPTGDRSWRHLQDDEVVCQVVRTGMSWLPDDKKNIALLAKARRHFFLGPDGYENVAKAEALLYHIEKSNSCRNVSVYVRLWPEADDDALYEWADRWNRRMSDKICDAEVVIIREEAIVSRKFLSDHPMLDCPDISVDTGSASVSGGFSVLLIGFGVQGERLMSDMICDAQFVKADGKCVPMLVDVVDRDASSFGWYKANCGDACSRYHIEFNCMDASDEGFWQWLKQRPPYNRILICTQDDVFNLSLANDIANFYAMQFDLFRKADEIGHKRLRDTIFVRVRRHGLSSSIQYSPHVGDEAMENVKSADSPAYQLFGDLHDTYNNILIDKWRVGAVFVNGVWNVDKEVLSAGEKKLDWYMRDLARNGSRFGQAKWKETSTFDKESSYAAFFHLRNILRLVGYRVWTAAPPDNYKQGIVPSECIGELRVGVANEKRRRRLAESEHLRWMAFHLLRGWRKWDPRPDELQELAGKDGNEVKPNSMKKRAHFHANLVDFDKLEALDERFNVLNRANGNAEVDSLAKDDDIVSGIEAIYKAGFTVTKA